jgi:predicted HicB family RNase H-like nuclease
LHVAFEEAVDDYLETCVKIGREPQKPASGKLMLRVPPEVHAVALRAAALTGKSLNQWAAKIIKEAVGI